jgi:hypothetical protein
MGFNLSSVRAAVPEHQVDSRIRAIVAVAPPLTAHQTLALRALGHAIREAKNAGFAIERLPQFSRDIDRAAHDNDDGQSAW